MIKVLRDRVKRRRILGGTQKIDEKEWLIDEIM
jgi:hypothetical protein